MHRMLSRYLFCSNAAPVIFSAVIRVIFGALAVLCCAFASGALAQEPGSATRSGPDFSPAIIWSELLQKKPFPYIAPLPPRVRTALDGTYTKFDPKKTPPVPCRRCPDYAPEGGIWKLNLDRGIFCIFHEVTGWRSLGSFVVDENRVQLFNDPCCTEVRGFYRWAIAEGRLILQAVEDSCAIGLRAKNLTQLPWLSCETPADDKAVDNQPPRPPGFE